MQALPPIQELWRIKNFKPNKNQETAILHVDGPLLLTAGPGSGKTRVLLWRTLNLIVYHNVKPEEIFLATFTEKAALQLRDGLRSLLALVTNQTGQPYDISRMAVGTVHAACMNYIIGNRAITGGQRQRLPVLMDELRQYFYIYNRSFWCELIAAGGWDTDEQGQEDAQRAINQFLQKKNLSSRHEAVTQVLAAFNRFSEESINPEEVEPEVTMTKSLLDMYAYYLNSLQADKVRTVDFALLQQCAYNTLLAHSGSANVFKHVIIDEYQDTNTIQERIFFHLANGSKNICVVGDDDQALYRFRGATVENLVEFEHRCTSYLNCMPRRLDLDINYRSRAGIVGAYTGFMEGMDWQHENGPGYYRVADKQIKAHSTDRKASVIITEAGGPADVCREIADFVVRLKVEGKIEDYCQVAFLFPSVKSNKVDHYREAFARHGVEIYAPRAGNFLNVPEAKAIWGLLMHIFGRPNTWGNASGGMKDFGTWVTSCWKETQAFIDSDPLLATYISDRRQEISTAVADYELLSARMEKKQWTRETVATEAIIRDFQTIAGLSDTAKRTLNNQFFLKAIQNRKKIGKEPFALSYILNRLTSPDWSILDLFYQLNGFAHFQSAYQEAEDGSDEGPICNLALISGYLGRFMEEYGAVITGSILREGRFVQRFFMSYTYALYRRGESEFEDADDPFPKGRIPFLTIHQSKGLEFPVVVLGNPARRTKAAPPLEVMARQLTGRTGEPLDRISDFDNMRMFYVALSRAQNLMILPRFKGQGQSSYKPISALLSTQNFRTISDCDTAAIPAAVYQKEELGAYYSYTGDYLGYLKCPRQYMIFRKYGFTPSRSQTMFFGSLVHQTIEDLHHLFIQERKKTPMPA